MDINTESQYDFFKDIVIANNGNIVAVLENLNGQVIKPNNQYEFLKRLKLTEEGYLKIVKI